MSCEQSAATRLRLQGIGKRYRLYARPQDRLWESLLGRPRHRQVTALDDISFEVRAGETVAFMGCNGAGKSTLLQIIAGVLQPSQGVLEVNGRVAALLELGAGFNPLLSGRENIYLVGALMGRSRAQLDAAFEQIVDFAGVAAIIEEPLRTYSSGMYVRLAFSLAVHVDPDILIVDEALAVGDEAFQSRCYGRLRELRALGTSVVFVTHASELVVELCDRALLLDRGELLMQGSPRQVVAWYQKLLFAPPQMREAVRCELLAAAVDIDVGNDADADSGGTAEIAFGETGTMSAADTATARFDPRLLDVASLRFAEHCAHIETPQLFDMSGRRVNLLQACGRYRYCFRVRFDAPFAGVRFGMMIKTVAGMDLGGRHTGEQRRDVVAGEVVEVTFTLSFALTPGIYFLNAGVLGEVAGEERFLGRIIDALQFRILPNDNQATGSVDFAADAHIVTLDANPAEISS